MTNWPGGSSFHTQYHWTNGSVYQQPYYNQQFTPAPPKCRLCRSLSVQPTYLNCKHAFCYVCLRAYVERQRYTDSLDFPCPHCNKLSPPPWGIWHLSHKVCYVMFYANTFNREEKSICSEESVRQHTTPVRPQ